MVDEDLDQTVTAPGTMNRSSGAFELAPVYVYQAMDLENLSSLAWAAQSPPGPVRFDGRSKPSCSSPRPALCGAAR
jgi:hypothetical protein